MKNLEIDWATQLLNGMGYLIHSLTPDIIQNTAWSTVYRINTNHGLMYLKKVPSALSLEPKIIKVLYEEYQAPVPHIIGVNQEQHCFLMTDAGIPLHLFFKKNFVENVLIKTLHDYITLQFKTIDKIHQFLDLGVPDWRLKKLPQLYRDLLTHESLLLEDGLTNEEILLLSKLESKLFSICEKLSHYKIKETFAHADFHDKNILINPLTLETTIIDLGEVVITHPFFSILNCLHMAKENFLLSDSEYQQMQNECLTPWLEFESHTNLLEILDLIQECWSIHAVLGEFRLLNSIQQSDLKNLIKQKRLAQKLRQWISQNNN